MNISTLILLFLVLFGMTTNLCAGRVGGTTERCLCQEKTRKRLNLSNANKVEIFKPSVSCSKTEIIVTLKSGSFCLDPDGKQGKMLLSGQKPKKKDKKQRNRKRQKKNKQQG